MAPNPVKFNGLSGNQLKIIALITMTVDHIGVRLLPQFTLLRIIGRLAFPIFAFMISEGCRYTKNRKEYLFSMAGLALVCQTVYFFTMQSLYQCVLVTFSLSILLIYALDNALKRKSAASWTLAVITFMAVFFICEILPSFLSHMNFSVDYGILGVMIPVFVYIGKSKNQQLILISAALVFLSINLQGIQWYSLGSLVLLALYNGKRGKLKMKYLFYVYYPLHLVAIYGLGLILTTR